MLASVAQLVAAVAHALTSLASAPPPVVPLAPIDATFSACVEVDPSTAGQIRCAEEALASWDESVFSHGWVLGGASRDLRCLLLAPVEDRRERTLVPLVQAAVAPESIVLTDQHGAYLGLRGVTHFAVNHAQGFVADYSRDVHANRIEGAWGLAKTLAAHVYRGFKRPTLDAYLDEVMFRYNHRVYADRVRLLSALLARTMTNS